MDKKEFEELMKSLDDDQLRELGEKINGAKRQKPTTRLEKFRQPGNVVIDTAYSLLGTRPKHKTEDRAIHGIGVGLDKVIDLFTGKRR